MNQKKRPADIRHPSKLKQMRCAGRFIVTTMSLLVCDMQAEASVEAVLYENVRANPHGAEMVKAIAEGKISNVDDLLRNGRIGIDDVISTCDCDCSARQPWSYQEPTHGGYGFSGGFDVNCGCYHFYDFAAARSAFAMEAARADIRLPVSSSSYSPYSEYGRNVNNYHYNIYGTPLMVAVRMRNTFMIKKLLERGANPNVFIRFGSVQFGKKYNYRPSTASFDPMTMYRPYNPSGTYFGTTSRPTPKGWNLADYEMTTLCALTDLYGTGTRETLEKDEDIAKLLVKAGAVFIKGEDDRGRTALWDAAVVRSTYLLNRLCENGWDVHHEDHMGKTIADYCTETLKEMSVSDDRERIIRFVRELGRLGCRVPSVMPEPQKLENVQPLGRNCDSQTDCSPVQPATITVPGLRPKPDNSVEIAALQHRLLALRMELEDARTNRKIATLQGTGWISASMNEQQIMREISDCERRVMELR